MALLNDKNFVRWEDAPTALTNQEFDTDLTGWTNVDHPIDGAGGEQWDWDAGNGGQAEASGLPDYSQGLSQTVTITKGSVWNIQLHLDETNDPSQRRTFFVDDVGNYQIVHDVNQDIGDVEYDFTVTADANYTKVVHATNIIPPRSNTQLSVIYFRMTEIVTTTCAYSLPLLEDDELKIFVNAVLDDSEKPFSTMKVGLWDNTNGFMVLRDIATLNQIVISGNDYSVYFEWTVASLAPTSKYKFVLYDDSSGDLLYYLSNLFEPISDSTNTAIVKYRNGVDAMNYLYSDVPTFYNQFRVDLWKGRAQFPENITGYETYEGDFIKVKSDLTKLVEFQTRFFDQGAHEAFSAMLAHSEIYIDTIQYKRTNDGSYDIDWHDFDDRQIANGGVNLLEVDYSTSVKKC